MKVHSIVGYDLDQKKLVGTIIDHGPYAATMTGDYDEKSKTVRWNTKAKDTNGKSMVQQTLISHKNANEGILTLMMRGEQNEDSSKFMQIRFVKRQ